MKKFKFPSFKKTAKNTADGINADSIKKPFWKTKKFLVSASICTLLFAGGIIGIIAMNSAQNTAIYNTAMANIAETRYFMKSAGNDTLTVQFYSGMREETYDQNGKATKLIEFAIINVDPKDNSLKDFHQIEGTVKIGEEQIPIVLAKNPYDRNFATDISRLFDVTKTVEVTLFITSTNHPTFQLENVMPDSAITWQEAVRVATDEVGHALKKTKGFETYVKITNETAKNAGAFWYIQFVCEEKCTHFCIVAPDGSVVGHSTSPIGTQKASDDCCEDPAVTDCCTACGETCNASTCTDDCDEECCC